MPDTETLEWPLLRRSYRWWCPNLDQPAQDVTTVAVRRHLTSHNPEWEKPRPATRNNCPSHVWSPDPCVWGEMDQDPKRVVTRAWTRGKQSCIELWRVFTAKEWCDQTDSDTESVGIVKGAFCLWWGEGTPGGRQMTKTCAGMLWP